MAPVGVFSPLPRRVYVRLFLPPILSLLMIVTGQYEAMPKGGEVAPLASATARRDPDPAAQLSVPHRGRSTSFEPCAPIEISEEVSNGHVTIIGAGSAVDRGELYEKGVISSSSTTSSGNGPSGFEKSD